MRNRAPEITNTGIISPVMPIQPKNEGKIEKNGSVMAMLRLAGTAYPAEMSLGLSDCFVFVCNNMLFCVY